MCKNAVTFRQLEVGQVFDWINPDRPHENSFFEQCRKISSRRYEGLSNGRIYKVGTVEARVFNVVR